MDDAFFMFWLIAKQGVDRAAAGYLFGIDPPSVGRYFITITCILEDFIRRQFPVMSDEEIYLTQHLKWANPFEIGFSMGKGLASIRSSSSRTHRRARFHDDETTRKRSTMTF